MDLRVADGVAIVKMYQGEDYLSSLKEACSRSLKPGMVVVSSIGQFKSVTLGYFRAKGDYSPKVMDGPLELLGVSGIISTDASGPFPHLHAVVGDRDMKVYGGHLLAGTVGLTNETVLLELGVKMERRSNEVHGTMDLHLS